MWLEINCRVALTKVFLEPDSFVSTADKFVTNSWRTGSITDYINDEWIYKECKAWFQLLEMVKSGLELLQ